MKPSEIAYEICDELRNIARSFILFSSVACIGFNIGAKLMQNVHNLYYHPSMYTAEDNRVFEQFRDNSFAIAGFASKDSEGKYTEIRKILTKSIVGEEAKSYAELIADTVQEGYKDKKYETLDSKIDLAKETIAYARSLIQRTDAGGYGNYTQGYEYSKLREKYIKGLEEVIREHDVPEEIKKAEMEAIANMGIYDGDSVQTFDEFLGPKNGKMFAGDCDDFSMALTTMYYALSEYAENNKDDEFFAALSEGLKHYRIYGLAVNQHIMNLAVTLKGKPEFEVIEPQDTGAKYTLEFKSGIPYVKMPEADGKARYRKILNLYNKDLTAELIEPMINVSYGE